MVDSTLCSDYVLFMHWLGEVDETLQRRCVRHILKRQLPDGGWNIYYGGPSEDQRLRQSLLRAQARRATAPKRPSCRKPAPTFCASAASRG